MAKRVELGCPGHFIGVDDCWFRRHTQVGKYRVSTVGEYRPMRGARTTLGAGSKDFFETMVFETTRHPEDASEGCGCRKPKSMSALECVRYATAGEANKGHERMVAKYMQK